MADLIQTEFRAAGFSTGVALAAVVNAYAESGLNPLAASPPPEDSVGLFQLNAEGVGHGMSREERQDPVLNTRRMIEYARREPRFSDAATDPDATLADLTRAFTIYLERPADAARKADARAELASRLFPDAYRVSGRALAKGGAGHPSATTLALVGASAALLVLLAWRFRDDIREEVMEGA